MYVIAGIVRIFKRCIPIATPIRNAIKIIQRKLCESSACSSHFKIAQNTIAVKQEDIA